MRFGHARLEGRRGRQVVVEVDVCHLSAGYEPDVPAAPTQGYQMVR
ncbi:hypothetical protein BH24CHL7_BH24CHL7_08400 [soil metagenome]|jgi:hypothetical protein